MVYPNIVRYIYHTRDKYITLEAIMKKKTVSIGKLENGKYNPSLKLAMDIAKVFGTSGEEVFFFEEDEE